MLNQMLQVRVPKRELLVHPDHPGILICIPKGGHTTLTLGNEPITEVFLNYYPPISYDAAINYYERLLGTENTSFIHTNNTNNNDYLTVYIEDKNKTDSAKEYLKKVTNCLKDLSLDDRSFIILFTNMVKGILIHGTSSENYIYFNNRTCHHVVNGIENNIFHENINNYIENNSIFEYTSNFNIHKHIETQRKHPFIKLNFPKTKVRNRITFSKIENLIIELTTVYCSFFSLTPTLNNLNNFNKIFNTIEGLEDKGFSKLDQNNKEVNINYRIMKLFKNNITNIENNLDSINLLNVKKINRHAFNDARFINLTDDKVNLVLDLENYKFDNIVTNRQLPLFEYVLLSLPKLDIKFKNESEFFRKILTILLYSMYLNDVHLTPTLIGNLSLCSYTINDYNNMKFKGGTTALDLPSKTIINLYNSLDKKILNTNPYDCNSICANIKKPVDSSQETINDILNSLSSIKL